MASSNSIDPFNPGTDMEEGEVTETQADQEPTEERAGGLAEAAQSAFGEDMGELGTVQETLPGTDYLKIKFLGTSKDFVEKQEMGDGEEFTFMVTGTVIGRGVKISKVDGTKKHHVDIDVSSVKLKK